METWAFQMSTITLTSRLEFSLDFVTMFSRALRLSKTGYDILGSKLCQCLEVGALTVQIDSYLSRFMSVMSSIDELLRPV